jgi:hypothetical protein
MSQIAQRRSGKGFSTVPDNSEDSMVLYVIIWLVVFLLCREIVCWYFKLTKIVNLLESIDQRLAGNKIELEPQSALSQFFWGKRIKKPMPTSSAEPSTHG